MSVAGTVQFMVVQSPRAGFIERVLGCRPAVADMFLVKSFWDVISVAASDQAALPYRCRTVSGSFKIHHRDLELVSLCSVLPNDAISSSTKMHLSRDLVARTWSKAD